MAEFTLDTSGAVIQPQVPGGRASYRWEWSDLSPFAQGYVEALFASLGDDPSAKRSPPARAKISRPQERLQEALSFLSDYSTNMRKNAPRGKEDEWGAVYWMPREPSYSWSTAYGDFQPATLYAGVDKGLIERKRDGYHEYRITPAGRAALHPDWDSYETCAECDRRIPRAEAACIHCGKTKPWAQPFGFSDLSPEALALILRDCEAYEASGRVVGLWRGDADQGAHFWRWRSQAADAAFPPLTPYLSDEGKVCLREAA